MRKLFVFILFVALSIICLTPKANAAQPRILNPNEAALVAQNCVVSQGSMQRLGNSDLATRVTRGRVYDYLLTKLIAPLNSRVALNRFDAGELTTTTTNIEQKFLGFKQDYTKYETALSSLVAFNCTAHPQEFYTQLEGARGLRAQVATDLADLDTLFDAYDGAVSKLLVMVPGGK